MGDEIGVGPGLRGIPRLNPMNGFEEYDGKFDPTNGDYMASCVFMGIVGYVFSILTVVFFLLLIVFKFIRKLFCCCPVKPPKPPSSKAVTVTNIMALIFTGICGIGCFLVFGGAPMILDGASGVTGALLDGVNPLQDNLDFIAEKMDEAEGYGIPVAGAGESMAALSESLDPVLDQVNDTDEAISANVGLVNQIFLGFAAIYLVFCIVGALAGWKKLGKTLWFLFFLAFFLLFIAWLLFGLSMTISQVSTDICNSIKQFLKDPENSDLSALMPCMDKDAALELEIGQKKAIASGLDGTGVCAPFTLAGADQTKEDCPRGEAFLLDDDVADQALAKLIKDIRDAGVPAPVAEAQGEAEFEQNDIENKILGARAIAQVIPGTIDLAKCTFVYDTFTYIKEDACKPLIAGLDLLYPGLCLISIGFNAMWIIYLVWAKRASAKPASDAV
jgi:hypothetical protein